MTSSKRFFSVFFRICVFLLILVLCFPLLIFPGVPLLPIWLKIPLVLGDLGFIFLFFKIRPSWKATFISILGAWFISVIAVITSYSQFNNLSAQTAFQNTTPFSFGATVILPGHLRNSDSFHKVNKTVKIDNNGKDHTYLFNVSDLPSQEYANINTDLDNFNGHLTR